MQTRVKNFLEKIIEIKRKDLIDEKQKVPLSVTLNSIPVTLSRAKGITKSYSSPAKRDQNDNMFYPAMSKSKHGQVAIIAEVKFASPTNPNLGSPEKLLERVKEYEKAGADAISIITEVHFFDGRLDFVYQVKKAVKIPVLQKDFVIDEYQIYQAKHIGSDAILLIARLVNEETLKKFVEIALEIGVEPVVEINDDKDLKKTLATNTKVIAVNARDLDTFDISLDKACDLLKKIPEKYIKLGFSGIHSKAEIDKYIKSGADGVLIGTAVMKTDNISQFLLSLRGGSFRPTRQSLPPEEGRIDFKSLDSSPSTSLRIRMTK